MPSDWIPKINRAKPDNQGRNKGCPAWPTSGDSVIGASREWCKKSRGLMAFALNFVAT